jgi:hypothetical protein
VENWHGGKVQAIRKNVLHLMRGQIYEIEGQTFFIMGGAACHDTYNGVLDMDDPEFTQKYQRLKNARKFFRINHLSWWERNFTDERDQRRLMKYALRIRKRWIMCSATARQVKCKGESKPGSADKYPSKERADAEFLQWCVQRV